MNVPIPGFPQDVGNRKMTVIDHYGPTSYLSGSDKLYPGPLGIGGALDFVTMPNPAVTPSGTYSVSIHYPTGMAGVQVQYITFKWYVVATGLEVTTATDLSAEYVRVQAMGY